MLVCPHDEALSDCLESTFRGLPWTDLSTDLLKQIPGLHAVSGTSWLAGKGGQPRSATSKSRATATIKARATTNSQSVLERQAAG